MSQSPSAGSHPRARPKVLAKVRVTPGRGWLASPPVQVSHGLTVDAVTVAAKGGDLRNTPTLLDQCLLPTAWPSRPVIKLLHDIPCYLLLRARLCIFSCTEDPLLFTFRELSVHILCPLSFKSLVFFTSHLFPTLYVSWYMSSALQLTLFLPGSYPVVSAPYRG